MNKIPQVKTEEQARAVCEFMSWKRIKSTAKARIRVICREEKP